MPSVALRRHCRRILLAGITACALLSVPAAGAQTVQLTFDGTFTGTSSGNAALRSAIGPLLGTGPFSISFTLDRGAAGSALVPSGTGTLYRAVSNVSSSFAGFVATNAGCISASNFICTVPVRNGTGVIGGTGSDAISVFTDIGRSSALQQAYQTAPSGDTRQLDFQFGFFFSDFTGLALGNESLGFARTSTCA